MSSNRDSKCQKTSLDAFSTMKGALLLNQVRDSAAHEHLLTALLHCPLPDTLGKLHNPQGPGLLPSSLVSQHQHHPIASRCTPTGPERPTSPSRLADGQSP